MLLFGMHFQYIREKAASFMICKKLEWFHSSFLVLNQLPEGYILIYGVITCVIGQKNLGMGCVLHRSSGFLWPQINLLVSSDLLKPRTYSLLKLRTNETKVKNTEKKSADKLKSKNLPHSHPHDSLGFFSNTTCTCLVFFCFTIVIMMAVTEMYRCWPVFQACRLCFWRLQSVLSMP